MRGKRERRWWAAPVIAGALLATTPVSAAPDNKPTPAAIDKARAQFRQGLALETGGDWAGALGMFQTVAAVKLTPQVHFHIGLCEEHLGRLVAAIGHYELAANDADAAGVAEVSAQVAARRDDLRARIPLVSIVRAAGADYASISLDGVTLGGSSVGTKLPVDPGPHSIEARAPGFKPFQTTFEVAEKESKKVEVSLERTAAPAATNDAPAPSVPSTPSDTNEHPAARTNLVPYFVGGVGVASFAAAGVFLLLRQSAISTLDDECHLPPGRGCPASAESTYNNGKTYSTMVNVTAAVGVVGVGIGAVLLLTQKKPTSTAWTLAPGAPASSIGASVSRAF